MSSPTPVSPPQRGPPDGKRMPEHTHVTRPGRGVPSPLTRLPKLTGATTAHAGSRDHTHASIGFSAPLVCSELWSCRTAHRAIRREGNIGTSEATGFPPGATSAGPEPASGNAAGATGACPAGCAGAHAVGRTGSGRRCWPMSHRRFPIHGPRICPHAWPQAAWRHQRSGSCSRSSSASACSTRPRCRSSASTSAAVKAGCGRVVKNRSETISWRAPPTRCVFGPAGWVALTTRQRCPSGPPERAGPSESVRTNALSGWRNGWSGEGRADTGPPFAPGSGSRCHA